jgi:hypothetical protein
LIIMLITIKYINRYPNEIIVTTKLMILIPFLKETF